MTIFTDKAKVYIPRLMTDLQITDIQACGIFGNLGTETGGFTALQEKKPTIAGSKGGYGWMQWTGPRRRKYEAWCALNHQDPASDQANYTYLVIETKTDEAHSLQQLRKTKTIEAATEMFMLQNLRPGVPNLENRISWAKQAYNALVSKDKVTTQVVATTSAVIATTAVAANVEPQHLLWVQDHWFLTMVVASAVTGLIIWGVHRYHEHQKQDTAIVLPVKGKKHG